MHILTAPQIFGYQHILYFILSVLAMIVTIIIIKKRVKTEKTLMIIIKSIGGLLLICILANRIGIAIEKGDARFLLPNSFCGLSSLALSLAILIGPKDNIALHCIMYVGVVGGIITMFYPDFINQDDSFFYPQTISGLLHHTVMVYLFFLCIVTKYFVPTIKKWYALIIGGSFYIIFGYFLIYIVGLENAMEINKPILSGTPLYWYLLAPIFLVIYFLIVGCFALYRKIKSDKLKSL